LLGLTLKLFLRRRDSLGLSDSQCFGFGASRGLRASVRPGRTSSRPCSRPCSRPTTLTQSSTRQRHTGFLRSPLSTRRALRIARRGIRFSNVLPGETDSLRMSNGNGTNDKSSGVGGVWGVIAYGRRGI
jgi:hypothetical protein